MLGIRQSSIYGNTSLKELENNLNKQAKELGLNAQFYSSNNEGDIVHFIHKSHKDKFCKGIIINPAGHSHYSIAILDALNSVTIPSIEVHISNVHKREEFRHNLLTAKANNSLGIISGLGINGYSLALQHFKTILN
jgi:3-dehydroquinate dehydratase-2